MKKTAILCILIAALLLVGCSGEPVPAEPDVSFEVEEPEPTPEVTAPEPVEEPEEEPAPEVAVEEEESDYNFDALPRDQQIKIKLVRKLLDNARNSQENYFYRYTTKGMAQTDVWVKGDTIKRSIHREDSLDKFTTYNMVYLDRNTKTAKGYCETTKSQCFEGHGPFTESFSTRNVKTPKDWTLELGDDFYWALDNRIADQLYHIIDYRMDDKIVRVYVNDYKGWPYRVEIYPPDMEMESVIIDRALEVHFYDDMDIGGVSDRDITPQ